MIENNYYSIAAEDKRCCEVLIQSGFYNNAVSVAQQSAEKFLKHVIIEKDLTNGNVNILKTYNFSY